MIECWNRLSASIYIPYALQPIWCIGNNYLEHIFGWNKFSLGNDGVSWIDYDGGEVIPRLDTCQRVGVRVGRNLRNDVHFDSRIQVRQSYLINVTPTVISFRGSSQLNTASGGVRCVEMHLDSPARFVVPRFIIQKVENLLTGTPTTVAVHIVAPILVQLTVFTCLVEMKWRGIPLISQFQTQFEGHIFFEGVVVPETHLFITLHNVGAIFCARFSLYHGEGCLLLRPYFREAIIERQIICISYIRPNLKCFRWHDAGEIQRSSRHIGR